MISMRVTYAILAITILAFIGQSISYSLYCPGPQCIEGADPFTYQFSLVPSEAILHGHVWQFVTYMFMHGGAFHIMFNMFVLLIFGGVVEQALGEKRFLALYLISGIGGALMHIGLTGISDVVMLGASGAIFGVLAAYGFMFPSSRIIIFPIPVPLPSWIAIIAIAGLQFLFGFFNLEEGIANFGHLGGIVTGAILTWFWRRRRPRSRHERMAYEFFWQ